MGKKRIRDFGIVPGRVKTGERNAITDVPGVRVGHCTVKTEENHTGVTVIVPGPDNAFAKHYTALHTFIMVWKKCWRGAGRGTGDPRDTHCSYQYLKCRKGFGCNG